MNPANYFGPKEKVQYGESSQEWKLYVIIPLQRLIIVTWFLNISI